MAAFVWRTLSHQAKSKIENQRAADYIPSGYSEALLSQGVPTLAASTSPLEDAIGLLKLVAEIEHSLMVQYLYSSLSLKGSAAREVSHIAIQEMGHLITVQNLLLSLTGVTEEHIPSTIYFERDKLRVSSSKNPMSFILEEISHIALSKYVLVERPKDVEDQDLETRLAELNDIAQSQGFDIRPVYAALAALRWIFQVTDENDIGLTAELGLRPGWHIKDSDFADIALVNKFTSQPIEWHSVPGLIVLPVRNRDEALDAIDEISAQGEGISNHEDSHFKSFLELLDNYEAGTLRIRKNLPRSPYVKSQPLPEDSLATEITKSYTALWARMFNIRYEMLLVDIAWSVSISRDSENRKKMIDTTIKSMNDVIQPLSKDLTQLDISDKNSLKAGPTYGLSNGKIPNSIDGYIERYTFLHIESGLLAEQIMLSPDIDVIGTIRLESLSKIDETRKLYLPRR